MTGFCDGPAPRTNDAARRFEWRARWLLAAALTAALLGCGTVMTAGPGGFLSSYEGLMPPAGETTAARRAAQPIDPAQAVLAELAWRVPATAEVTAAEQQALMEQLQTQLREQLGGLPAAVNGRPVRLRAAITRVEPVSPVLNAASALLLFVPLDRGGAAIEIEAVDAQTGQQLAALRMGYFAPMSELKARFSRLAPAEIALKKAAADFARLLQPDA